MSTTIETIRIGSPAPAAPTPPVRQRRLGIDFAMVGGTSFICQAIGVVTSLAFRALLSPAEMGVWQGLKLFLSYGNYANLGISKGAARELSVAMGRGDEAGGARGVHLAYSASMASSAALAIVLLIVAAVVWNVEGAWSRAWAVGIAFTAVVCLLQRHVTFLITILRARREFRVTSEVTVLESVMTLAVGVLAIWMAGLPGMYISVVAVLVASWIYIARRAPYPLAWAWDYAEIRRLTLIGGPILLAGVASTFFRSLDKLMILAFMSDREYHLGCYSLALLASGQLYGLANMMSIVLAPRLAQMWGRAAETQPVARLAARSSEILAAMLGVTSGLAVAAGGPLLAAILPAYGDGVEALAILAPGVACMGLSLPAHHYLVAVDKQRRALTTMLTVTAVSAAITWIAIRAGWGLPGVAAATSVSYAFCFWLLVVRSFWSELDASDRRRYLMNVAVVGIVPSLVVLCAQIVRGGDIATLPALAFDCALVAVVSAPLAWRSWRRGWQTEPLEGGVA